jgi:thioredoxin 1
MSNQWVKEITQENFQTEVMQAAQPVLLDFWAPWCGPCRMVSPHVEAVAEQMAGQAVVGKVNVDEHPALAQQFGVMSIPTLVVIVGGNLVAREVGARGQEAIERMLSPHLVS